MISTIYLLYLLDLLATSAIFQEISEILPRRLGSNSIAVFGEDKWQENSRLWLVPVGKVLEFQGSKRGALHVPRVFKTVIDVSESEVVERVQQDDE